MPLEKPVPVHRLGRSLPLRVLTRLRQNVGRPAARHERALAQQQPNTGRSGQAWFDGQQPCRRKVGGRDADRLRRRPGQSLAQGVLERAGGFVVGDRYGGIRHSHRQTFKFEPAEAEFSRNQS